MVVPNILFLAVSHRTSEARFYYITGEYDARTRRMREKAFPLSQLNGGNPCCDSDACEPRDQGVLASVRWRVRERDRVGCSTVEVTVGRGARGEGCGNSEQGDGGGKVMVMTLWRHRNV